MRGRLRSTVVAGMVAFLILLVGIGLWKGLQVAQEETGQDLRTFDARLLHSVDGRARYWTEQGKLLRFQGGASLVQPRLGLYAANLDKSDRTLSLLNRETGDKKTVDTEVLDCIFNAEGTLLYYFKQTGESLGAIWGSWYLYQIQEERAYQVTPRVRQDHFWISPDGRSFAFLLEEWKVGEPKLQVQTVWGTPQVYTLPLDTLPLTLPNVQEGTSPVVLLVQRENTGAIRLYQTRGEQLLVLAEWEHPQTGSVMQWFSDANGREYLMQWGTISATWNPNAASWSQVAEQPLHWLLRNADVYWSQNAQWGQQLASVWYFGEQDQSPKMAQTASGGFVYRFSETASRALPNPQFQVAECLEGASGVYWARSDGGELWKILPDSEQPYQKLLQSAVYVGVWAHPKSKWLYGLTKDGDLLRLNVEGVLEERIAEHLPADTQQNLYFSLETGQVWFRDSYGSVWTQKPGEQAQKLTEPVVDYVPVDPQQGSLLLAKSLRKDPVDLVDLYFWTPESGESQECAQGIYHPFARYHYIWLQSQR